MLLFGCLEKMLGPGWGAMPSQATDNKWYCMGYMCVSQKQLIWDGNADQDVLYLPNFDYNHHSARLPLPVFIEMDNPSYGQWASGHDLIIPDINRSDA